MNTHIPHNAQERNYAIFGKKIRNEDAEIFNKFKDEYIVKLKNINKIFISILILIICISAITAFNIEGYWSAFKLSTTILFFFIYVIFLLFIVPYRWLGLYARSWIKLLELRNIRKFTFLQKINYSSILYPSVKSYLENNGISLFITENDLRPFASSPKKFNELKRIHAIFDESMLEYDSQNE